MDAAAVQLHLVVSHSGYLDAVRNSARAFVGNASGISTRPGRTAKPLMIQLSSSTVVSTVRMRSCRNFSETKTAGHLPISRPDRHQPLESDRRCGCRSRTNRRLSDPLLDTSERRRPVQPVVVHADARPITAVLLLSTQSYPFNHGVPCTVRRIGIPSAASVRVTKAPHRWRIRGAKRPRWHPFTANDESRV